MQAAVIEVTAAIDQQLDALGAASTARKCQWRLLRCILGIDGN